MSITVQNVSKRFGAFPALDGVSLEAPSGSLLALLGPSGSGKTTLLRIIAGLETADAGAVLYHDEDVTHTPARDRNVGFVFQHYALFRHMTVFENIAFGLRVRGWPDAEVRQRVRRVAAADPAGRAGAGATRRSCPAASGSAWPWRGRWRPSRRCCCWTSRSAPWTPRCGWSCGSGCGGCTTRST